MDDAWGESFHLLQEEELKEPEIEKTKYLGGTTIQECEQEMEHLLQDRVMHALLSELTSKRMLVERMEEEVHQLEVNLRQGKLTNKAEGLSRIREGLKKVCKVEPRVQGSRNEPEPTKHLTKSAKAAQRWEQKLKRARDKLYYQHNPKNYKKQGRRKKGSKLRTLELEKGNIE